MIYTNFNFLNNEYPILYKIISQAIDNIYTDTDTTIYKIRKFVETIVDIFLNLEDLQFESDFTLYKKIDLLREFSNLECIEALNALRILGNKIVHGGHADINLSISAINLCYYISQILMTNYHDFTFVTDEKIKKPMLESITNSFSFNINDSDNKLFNSIMNDLTIIIFSLIIDDKLDGIGYIEEIHYVSYKEFYYYFIKGLKYYSSLNLCNAKNIIHIKNILKQKLNTIDNNYINNILCENIYAISPWKNN